MAQWCLTFRQVGPACPQHKMRHQPGGQSITSDLRRTTRRQWRSRRGNPWRRSLAMQHVAQPRRRRQGLAREHWRRCAGRHTQRAVQRVAGQPRSGAVVCVSRLLHQFDHTGAAAHQLHGLWTHHGRGHRHTQSQQPPATHPARHAASDLVDGCVLWHACIMPSGWLRAGHAPHAQRGINPASLATESCR